MISINTNVWTRAIRKIMLLQVAGMAIFGGMGWQEWHTVPRNTGAFWLDVSVAGVFLLALIAIYLLVWRKAVATSRDAQVSN